jgi:lysophospholipase L1-like esterase
MQPRAQRQRRRARYRLRRDPGSAEPCPARTGPVRAAVAAVLVVAAAALLTSCSGPRQPGPATYYLALGDSLSQGVQPDAAGTSTETAQGYPDLVYAQLRRGRPTLRLTQLGCPGETTKTMIQGGLCRYPGGSQLAAAVAFLRAHQGQVLLITIDIGANDPEECGSQSGLGKLASCVGQVPGAAANLTTILTKVRAAAGPGVRIVGMSYYLPALAEWRSGMLGRAVAWSSERLAVAYNDLLDHAYAQADAGVADVLGAFDTTNFGNPTTVPGLGSLPRNVALICEWTWECAPPPRGPNQHPNPAGYRVIASAFLKVVNLS